MAHSHTTQSHPICPTCECNLTGREDVRYFVSARLDPLKSDDISNLYEETSRLVRFLGALAQAGPLAVAQGHEVMSDPPDWVGNLSWLAEELTQETERRLLLLNAAGQIWQRRVEEKTTKKEG